MPDISIKSLDGSQFGGYVAFPQNENASGLIVIQEIFGINVGMRKLCDIYADQGYLAVCPDLFWRQSPNVQLTDKTEAEWDRAFMLYKNFDVEASARDLLATLAHVRRMPECNGKVGAVGYGLGGRLAWILASRSDIDCTIGYYGVGLDPVLDEVHEIRMPFMLHLAEKDKMVPPSAQQKILAAAKRNSVISVYSYPGAEHAFARVDGQSFRADVAALANQRTLEFLTEHLKT